MPFKFTVTNDIDSAWNQCEHVALDNSLLYGVHEEYDSFGPVEKYGVCKACFDEGKEQEDNEVVVCKDCKQKVLSKDVFYWMAYDGSEIQGDEYITICNDCYSKEPHVKRRADDKAREEAELKYYNR